MSNIVGECTVCCAELRDNDEAYALTSGTMSLEMQDFCMSDATPWEVVCPACMTEIDKLIHDLRVRFNVINERTTP